MTRSPERVRSSWLESPQRAPLRKVLFLVHSWLGIGVGLYVAVISISGSAVVFRREVSRWLMPQNHVFGDALPTGIRIMEWLVDLHDNLLGGTAGRRVNGVGGLLVCLLIVTGAVIWWPGRNRWRVSLVPPRPWAPRFSWRLHSAAGFWTLAPLLCWALTGVYFAFPEPFEALLTFFDPTPETFERPGEGALLAMIDLHFGRFGGLGVRILWVALGLLPALLVITGAAVWWKRTRPVEARGQLNSTAAGRGGAGSRA